MEHDVTATEPPCAGGNVWKTSHPEWYLRHYLQPPPRRWGYLSQLRLDAAGKQTRILWAVGGGLIVLGLASRSWLTAHFGFSLLILWLACFLLCVRSMRNDRVGTGVIRSMRPNPIARDASIASVLLPDGTVGEVGVITELVAGFLAKDGQCEVLFHGKSNSPNAGGMVFAAREISASGALLDLESALPDHARPDPGTRRGLRDRARYLLPVLAGIALFMPPVPHGPEPTPRDLMEMQGDWKLVYMVSGGEKVRAEELVAPAPLVIRGRRWAGYMWVEAVTLYPRREPKAIDAVSTKAKGPRQVRLQGIYKMEGDTLTVSWSAAGRPASLTKVAATDAFFRFERKKP